MSDTTVHTTGNPYDIAIIGGGMAGSAAAFFAARKGMRAFQACGRGGLIFSSGLLDLMAVHPCEELKTWDDPWAAIDTLSKDSPKHPYTRAGIAAIRKSMSDIISFLNEKGLPYHSREKSNIPVITAAGTIKLTYAVPASMRAGAEAFEKKAPCVIVGFRGLKEFSASQVAGVLSRQWPSLKSAAVTFPGTEEKNEVFAAHLAQALENADTVKLLAAALKPHLSGASFCGLPAVLGIHRTAAIHEALEKELGLGVFEIPTMPTSVPGLRLREFFDRALPELGVVRANARRAEKVTQASDSLFDIALEGEGAPIRAKNLLIATGRFLGKGLVADRTMIYEPVMNLPVTQPRDRTSWHHADFLAPGGHTANRCGLELDGHFRPADVRGESILDNIFAAGSILAHQDWMRMKCGSGLSIATAFAAVEGCASAGKK